MKYIVRLDRIGYFYKDFEVEAESEDEAVDLLLDDEDRWCEDDWEFEGLSGARPSVGFVEELDEGN